MASFLSSFHFRCQYKELALDFQSIVHVLTSMPQQLRSPNEGTIETEIGCCRRGVRIVVSTDLALNCGGGPPRRQCEFELCCVYCSKVRRWERNFTSELMPRSSSRPTASLLPSPASRPPLLYYFSQTPPQIPLTGPSNRSKCCGPPGSHHPA